MSMKHDHHAAPLSPLSRMDMQPTMRSGNSSGEKDSSHENIQEIFHKPHGNMSLPHAIIIGAAKCGANPLSNFLGLHPKIYVASGLVDFFNREDNYKKGLVWYSQKMPAAPPDGVILERSPGYFYDELTPRRIRAMNSSIKIILIVRDPIQRLLSEYAQFKANRVTKNLSVKPLSSLVVDEDGLINTEYPSIQYSTYDVYLERWLRVFPRGQIHVVDGDTFIRNPIEEIWKIEKFLGLQQLISQEHMFFNYTLGYFCPKKRKCYDHVRNWQRPTIDFSLKDKLRMFFHSHNQRFIKLSGQHVLEWL